MLLPHGKRPRQGWGEVKEWNDENDPPKDDQVLLAWPLEEVPRAYPAVESSAVLDHGDHTDRAQDTQHKRTTLG